MADNDSKDQKDPKRTIRLQNAIIIMLTILIGLWTLFLFWLVPAIDETSSWFHARSRGPGGPQIHLAQILVSKPWNETNGALITPSTTIFCKGYSFRRIQLT